MGTQPSHAYPGVRACTFHMNKMPMESWDNVVETLSKVEDVMSSLVTTNALQRLNLGIELIEYQIMTAGKENLFLLPLKIFGGVAFGYQVHNRIHTDDDFSRSVVTVHIDQHQYECSNKVVAYFSFP